MKKSVNASFYPILVNLERFPCLIIGGGKVAYRKALSLQEFDANITIISPRICKPLLELSKKNKIQIIKKTYSKEFLKDFKIIFSATDNPEVNKNVRNDCTKEGVLLNVVDNPALCDFILPANIKRGNLTISVSSQGIAPFYTKVIKGKIDRFISPVYSEIIDLAGKFRKQILNRVDTESKAKMFKSFSSINWEKILTENGTKSSNYYIKKILREFNFF